MVEQWRDKYRQNYDGQNPECDRQSRAPQPPHFAGPPDREIQQRQHDHRSRESQRELDAEIAQPLPERLVGQAIGMLAEKSFIQSEGECCGSDQGNIGRDIEDHLITSAMAALFRPILDAHRKSRP